MPSNPNSRMGKDLELEAWDFFNALQWFCSKFFVFLTLEVTKGRLGFRLGLCGSFCLGLSVTLCSGELFWRKAWQGTCRNSWGVFRTRPWLMDNYEQLGNRSKTQNIPEVPPNLKSFEHTQLWGMSWLCKTAA